VLDGVNYQVTFDFNAICAAETLTGENLLDAIIRPTQLTANQLRGLLYANIVWPDAKKPPTLDQIGALLTPFNIVPVNNAINEAVLLYAPPKPATTQNSTSDEVEKQEASE
jgi:hypothetical protein